MFSLNGGANENGMTAMKETKREKKRDSSENNNNFICYDLRF